MGKTFTDIPHPVGRLVRRVKRGKPEELSTNEVEAVADRIAEEPDALDPDNRERVLTRCHSSPGHGT